MKRPSLRPIVFLLRRLPLVLAVLALGCLAVTPLSAAPKIGVLLKGTSGFWNAVEQGATAAAKKSGAEIVVRKPVSESDIAIQVQLLNELVAQGIQALVIAPCSSTALSEPVAAAVAKGIKLVVIDTALNTDMPVFIATNHTDAGTAAGELLASLVHASDEISFLKHSKTSGATTLRELSAFSVLHRVYPSIVINRDIFSGTVAGHEIEQARLLLQTHPHTKGILASGTPGSMAMLQALQETKLAGSIKFVGFGFNLNPTVAAALESGAMHGWIAQLPNEIGTQGTNAALALLAGRPTAEVSFCEFRVITKANLHDPAVQALLPP